MASSWGAEEGKEREGRVFFHLGLWQVSHYLIARRLACHYLILLYLQYNEAVFWAPEFILHHTVLSQVAGDQVLPNVLSQWEPHWSKAVAAKLGGMRCLAGAERSQHRSGSAHHPSMRLC